MLPVILLYAFAGALLSGGLLGGKHLLDLASDEAAKERLRRRMRNEQELLRDALASEAVRKEAAAQGVDLDALQRDIQTSRESQEKLIGVLGTVLKAQGTSAEAIRRCWKVSRPAFL
jgi:hypothetical protein